MMCEEEYEDMSLRVKNRKDYIVFCKDCFWGTPYAWVGVTIKKKDNYWFEDYCFHPDQMIERRNANEWWLESRAVKGGGAQKDLNCGNECTNFLHKSRGKKVRYMKVGG